MLVTFRGCYQVSMNALFATKAKRDLQDGLLIWAAMSMAAWTVMPRFFACSA
jgi:hypothetical protein